MLEKLSRFEKEQMRNAELREKMIVIFNEISVEMSRQISEKKANPHIQIGLNDKFRLVKVEEKYWIVPDFPADRSYRSFHPLISFSDHLQYLILQLRQKPYETTFPAQIRIFSYSRSLFSPFCGKKAENVSQHLLPDFSFMKNKFVRSFYNELYRSL